MSKMGMKGGDKGGDTGGGWGGSWGGDKGGDKGGFKGGGFGGKSGSKGPGKFTVDESGGNLGEFVGTIKSFNDKNGYGFITCPELGGYGDVFLHGAMKKDFQRGQQVKFTAVLTKDGKPQAKDLRSGP